MRATSLLALLVLPLLNGCLFTQPMWRNANETLAADGRPVAVVDASAETGDGRLLILRYTVGFDDYLYATLPLSQDGRPDPPFHYEGDARRPEVIAAGLSEERRQLVRDARLALHDQAWLETQVADPRFRRLSWETDGKSVEHDLLEGPPSDGTGWGGDNRQTGVRVMALRLGRPWTDAEIEAMPLPVARPIEYPADAPVLLLPYAQPRPERDRRNARRRATLLTPITLVGDAVCVPFLYVACYVFHACP